MNNQYDNPAYPIQGFCDPNGNVTYPEFGLTKRELAVFMAMHGLLSIPQSWTTSSAILADVAVSIADATLAAMEQEKKG